MRRGHWILLLLFVVSHAFRLPMKMMMPFADVGSIFRGFEKKSLNMLTDGRLQERDLGTLLNKIRKNEVMEIVFADDLQKVVSMDTDLDVYQTTISPIISTEIVQEGKEHNTHMFFQPINKNWSYLGQALLFSPFLFIGFQIIQRLFSMNRMVPMGGNGGKSLPQGYTVSSANGESPILLEDWAGSPEVFEECAEIVSYLKNSTLYKNAGARIPRGILLEGPPGTGKTLLARAIANEAQANFFAVTGSEFVELFVGMGALRVRKLFADARNHKPSIIFIDEIDALGKQRNSASGFGGNDEREQTLNQLLAEMDGFRGAEEVLVLGATNRRDILDSALLRPGRFDRVVNVPLPDAPSRRAILEVHCKRLLLEETISWDAVVSLTAGFSGAQLKNLLNEAAILCAREAGVIITQTHLMSALEKLVIGIVKKTETRDQETLERVAIHEIGHTLAVLAFPEMVDLDKVSIQSTYGGTGGYTLFREKETLREGGLYTKSMLFSQLVIMLGGKAAEHVYYGQEHVSLGSYQDLKQANDLARKMIMDYGMGNTLTVYARTNKEDSVSEYMTSQVDEEALILLNQAYHNATTLLTNDFCKMISLKDRLLEKRVLLPEEVIASL